MIGTTQIPKNAGGWKAMISELQVFPLCLCSTWAGWWWLEHDVFMLTYIGNNHQRVWNHQIFSNEPIHNQILAILKDNLWTLWNNHPNRQNHIFERVRYTTNQWVFDIQSSLPDTSRGQKFKRSKKITDCWKWVSWRMMYTNTKQVANFNGEQ